MANGLLDFYSSPAQMGMLGLTAGLLEAGGPSRLPVSLGQGLGRGLLQGAQLSQGAAQTQLAQTYLGEQIKQLQAANARQQMMMPILQGFASQLQNGQQVPQSGAAPTQPMVGVSDTTAASIGAPWAAASQIQQPQASQTPAAAPQNQLPLSLRDITLLKLIGGPDLTDAYTAGRPSIQSKDGVMFDSHTGQITGTHPTTNNQGFATQLIPDGKGGFQVGMVPGSAQAYQQQQMITQGANALFGAPVTIPSSRPDQPPTMTSPYNFAVNQGAPDVLGIRGPAPAAPGGGPRSSAPGVPAGLSPTQQSAVDADRMARNTAARGDAERVQKLEEKIPSLLSVDRRLTAMADLTKDDQTFAAAGAEVKKVLGSIVQGFGLKVNEEKTARSETYLAHVAELLKDRLASKDFGSGSGVSNLDIIAAQKPLPDLANTPQGRLQIINALKADTQSALRDAQAARDYFDANYSLRNFQFPSEKAARERALKDALPREPGTPPQSLRLPEGVTVKRIR